MEIFSKFIVNHLAHLLDNNHSTSLIIYTKKVGKIKNKYTSKNRLKPYLT